VHIKIRTKYTFIETFITTVDISKRNTIIEGDPPPFWYAVFRGNLDGTQYAKGRYAVRRNSVISYADINCYFKKVQLSSQTQHTWHTKSINSKKNCALATLALFGLISAFLNLKMDFRIWRGQNIGNLTSKHTNPNVFKNYCTCAYNIL